MVLDDIPHQACKQGIFDVLAEEVDHRESHLRPFQDFDALREILLQTPQMALNQPQQCLSGLPSVRVAINGELWA